MDGVPLYKEIYEDLQQDSKRGIFRKFSLAS